MTSSQNIKKNITVLMNMKNKLRKKDKSQTQPNTKTLKSWLKNSDKVD